MKKIFLRAVLMLMLASTSTFVCAAQNKKGGSVSTPGNSSNPNGQQGGPGVSDKPVPVNPSGTNGNQGNGPNRNNGNAGGQHSKPQVPIDGGLSILLLAGAGLGAAKMMKKKGEE